MNTPMEDDCKSDSMPQPGRNEDRERSIHRIRRRELLTMADSFSAQIEENIPSAVEQYLFKRMLCNLMDW